MANKNICENDFHSPSKYKNPIVRFFHFLFYKNKLYYHKDDTALCAQCNDFIRTPLAYYHWGTKAAYVLIGALTFAFSAMVPQADYGDRLIRCSIIGMSFFLLIRIIDAFVFAVFSWRVFDVTEFSPQAYSERAKNERHCRYWMILCGIVLGFGLSMMILLLKSH